MGSFGARQLTGNTSPVRGVRSSRAPQAERLNAGQQDARPLSAALRLADLAEDRRNRLPDDVERQPPGARLDVLDVVLDPLLEVVAAAARALDLPEAGDA